MSRIILAAVSGAVGLVLGGTIVSAGQSNAPSETHQEQVRQIRFCDAAIDAGLYETRKACLREHS